jgi:hypothetical protein
MEILQAKEINSEVNMAGIGTIELENMALSGRSHYWGEVYVSLEGMQIEYAGLTEDVLTDAKIDGLPGNILGYTVRKIDLSRIN